MFKGLLMPRFSTGFLRFGDSTAPSKGGKESGFMRVTPGRALITIGVLLTAVISFIEVPWQQPKEASATSTWVPGSYWVATSRGGMTNSNAAAPHSNAVAAYGNGTFVVGGSGSTLSPYLISSRDGENFVSRKRGNWTITEYQRTNNVVTITTLEDHLVSVGERFPISNTTLQTALGGTSQYAVTAVPNATSLIFTLAGADIAATTTSLVNDYRANAGASALVFGGEPGSEVFLMSGTGGPNKVWRSADGENWSVVAVTGDNGGRTNYPWMSATYAEGKFVALTSDNKVIYSADNGSTWLAATVPSPLATSTWTSITYGDGRFVAVSSTTAATNQVMTSEDGITWTARLATAANNWRSVAYGDGSFVAVSSTGTNRIMTSEDGLTWTARNVSNHSTANWRTVVWAGTAFVAAAESSVIASTVDLGVTWTSAIDATGGGGGAFNNATLTAMTWTGSMLFGVPNETAKAIAQSFAPSAPTVSSRTPASGTSAGGTSVVFSGNYLRSVISVLVDGQSAPITARTGGSTLTTLSNNSSSVTVTMPAAIIGGTGQVVLTGLGGTATSSFTYNWPAPTLTTNVAATGSSSGGNTVTLTGTNLTGASAVTLGTSLTDATENRMSATSFVVTGSTSIAVVVPPRPCGQNATDWFFRVTTPGGTTSGSSNFKHTYSPIPSPLISSLGTTSGAAAGGQSVVINGTDFVCVNSVMFGTQAASSFTVDSPTQVTAVTPAGTSGSVAVTLTTSSGSATSSSNFTYTTTTIATTTTVAASTTVAPPVTVVSATTTVASTTTSVAVARNMTGPMLVTSANQAALTASPGKASVLVNGVAVAPQIVTASNSAAAQADPAERTPEQVRELQQAAATIETRLDTIAGGDSGVSVVRTETGAVMTGVFTGVRVPVEDVVVVNAADTATLFAARDVRGNIVEVKPGAVLEVASNGDVAVQAFGLRPGESVELVVMSTPTLLGSFTVDAKGSIKTTAKLPTTIGSGNHSLVVASPSVKASLGLKLVKSSASLPVTGSNTSNANNLAVAMLLSGMYLVLVSRSRRRVL
jgi:hypothetical protein